MQDTDLMLLTRDNVFFCAHRSTLLRESSNCFGGLIENESPIELVDMAEPSMENLEPYAAPSVVVVPYPADVLNVLLHLVYGLSVEKYQPSAHTLRAVLPALRELGYDIHAFVTPHSELFALFVQASVAAPLPMYALAAQYALEPLAVAISPLTLSGSLCNVSDELSRQMGSIYLKRLFCTSPLPFFTPYPKLITVQVLHLGRIDALKCLVLAPPATHLPAPGAGAECNPDTQKAIARAWALACAHVVVDGRTDALAALSAHVQCSRCQKNMDERVAAVVSEWNAVKRTI
ncbi:hypothetical protein FRC08_017325 [Ceratobasidium sp. 394]|nr:hypothetical protein FRC08_017325 [Ceratobasidium sp. 394]